MNAPHRPDLDRTFAGIMNQQTRAAGVKGYRGMAGSVDGMRGALLGAWVRCLQRFDGKPPPVLSFQLTVSELCGYYWAKHRRRAYHQLTKSPHRGALARIYPTAETILKNVCEPD